MMCGTCHRNPVRPIERDGVQIGVNVCSDCLNGEQHCCDGERASPPAPLRPLPAIIRWGAGQLRDYRAWQIEASLRRVFRADPDSFIVLDSYPDGQRFAACAAAWAIGQGLLYIDQVVDDGQSEVCSLRLTAAGRVRYCADAVTP